MNILITGGAGNIGSNLAFHLSSTNQYNITVVDNLSTGFITNVPIDRKNVRFIKADVNEYSDIAPIIINGNFTYIFHYAAVVGVERTINNPLLVFKDIDGMKNIFSLAKNTEVDRVFFSSSSEVYGEPVEIPQQEDTTPLNSKLPYAIVKNIGESLLKAYFREYGLKYTIFRFFNTYGLNQSDDFVITRFISRAIRGEDIHVYGDGSQTRTFLPADDNSQAVIKILESDLFVNEIVNIGSDEEISILRLAELIIELSDSKSNIVHSPPLPEGDMTRRKPNIDKIRSKINFKPTPLKSYLADLIAEMRKGS